VNQRTNIELGEVMADGVGSTDPSRYPDETFALYSIPAFDVGAPEFVQGRDIGSVKKNVQPNDVLLSRIVPHIRRSWVVGEHKERLLASGEWIVFRDARIYPAYLRHFLTSDLFHRQFMMTVAGVGGSLLRARPADVARIALVLPPLEEQRRIAAILDKADALRQKRKRAIALLDSLTQSIFLEMFGDPPPVWSSRPLSDVVKPGTIVTYGIVQAGEEFPGGVPYIRTGDIQGGRINTNELRHTSPQIAAKFARSRVEHGELVMSIRATVGTVASVPKELDGANLTQGTARIAPGPDVKPEYLINYLRSDTVQRWIAQQVKGATFLEITLGRLRELVVLVPPLSLQALFASRARVVERQIELLSRSLSQLERNFLSLQHRAFSGQL